MPAPHAPYWEDIAVKLCCGEHCDANNACVGHDIGPDRYTQMYGCQSEEIYNQAVRVAEWLKTIWPATELAKQE